MTPERLQNILGALALKIADGILDKVDAFVPRDEPAAAIALIGRSPGWLIRQLSDDLGLSHAATVRLVDRLVADGLMQRTKSAKDARAIELTLTETGKQIYNNMLEIRHRYLGEFLSCLSDHEKDVLGKISEKLIGSIAKDTSGRSRTCRFCDVARCKICPIDAAVAAVEL